MPPAPEHRPVDRRKFLRAAGAALSMPAASYAAVPGSNARVRVGFVGCGGRAQAHLHLAQKLAAEGLAAPAAVCDVWDGHEDEYDQVVGRAVTRRRYSQGLYPAAKACGLDPADAGRVTKDYRRVLDRADVDVVVVSTPDHWHARMTLDALAAGKDVLVETPLARTPAEAAAVLAAAEGAGRVVAVGVQGLTDPAWAAARDLVRAGRVGPVVHLSAGAFRADPRGYWRFLRVVPEMNPRTVDWDLWLGHRFEVGGDPVGPPPGEVPFDAGVFAQWRCHARFGGGPFADLFAPAAARLIFAAGVGQPARVTGAGGLFHERDGRDVPDVATVVADFPEGCQLVVTGSTAAAGGQDDVIRGRAGALKVARGGVHVLPGGEVVPAAPPRNETEALWRDFLGCVGDRGRVPACPVGVGAAAAVVAGLADASSRAGRALPWPAG